MNKKLNSIILVIISSLVLSFLYCPIYDIYFDDKEIFKYTGYLIYKGKVPYKDFFDHKPPMIFFINYLGFILGSWGFWVVDALLVLGTSLLFLKLNFTYKVVYPAVLPILFNLLLRNNSISFGIGMTREYTTILLLVVFCIVVLQARYKYLYFGLISTLIFLFQQEQVLLVLPSIFYSIWNDYWQQRMLLKSIGWLIIGALIILGPLLFYFAINSALNDFWQSAFVFNTRWYTTEQKPGFVRELIVIKNYIYELKFDILIVLTLTAGVASLLIGNEKKGLLIISLISIPLSFISEFLSGKIAIGNAVLIYYFLPLAATLPFCIFLAFAFTKRAFFKNKYHQFIYCSLLMINLWLSILVYTVNYHKYPQTWITNSPVIKYLETDPPKNYDLYIFNNSNYTYAYNRFGILIPSKWLYHYFWEWYPKWDADGSILQNIISDLMKHRTKYIIYNQEEGDFKNIENQKIWHLFLKSSYQQVNDLPLWKLKGT